MNVERLHVIANAIIQDISQTNSETLLQQLVNALQQQVNQPQQPAYQQEVSNHLQSLLKALAASPSNEFSPTWKQVIEEIGAQQLLGVHLSSEIQKIFERNQITPSVALSELQKLHQQLQKFREALDHIISAFQYLRIGKEELKPGECEIGVLIPRAFVNDRLDKFASELNELDRIFEVFSELVTGSRPSFQIRSISSSELTVFLDSIPTVAACIAIAVERIVSLYKQLLEIRKLHNELTQQGISKDKLKGVEEHASSLMERGIEVLIKELLKTYYKKSDEPRKHELTTELRFSLKKVANRVDRGFNIEIRVEPLPTKEQQEGEQGISPEASEDYAAIMSAAKNLQFIKLAGDPILSLPESEEKKSKKD